MIAPTLCQTRALRPRPLLRSTAGVGLLIALAVAPARAEPGPMIRLRPEGDPRAIFSVEGLEPALVAALASAQPDRDALSALFAVYAVPADAADTKVSLPILGTYRIESGAVHFHPRFPLEPGLIYRARFDPSKLPDPGGRAGSSTILAADFSLPRRAEAPATRLKVVYPTRDVLPENLLKLYLHFSAPMSRGMAYASVHIRDASGKDVAFPFVELAEELWDPRGERLTLLFNPGRIKTGLKPREELGPIFRAGETYTIVVDRGWLDAAGRPLASDYRKTFRAGPADSQPPDPATWSLKAPEAGTRNPLLLTFPEPLDHAMLGRVLNVHDGDGQVVPGDVTIEAEETRWRFTPDHPWRDGVYSVLVDKDLEDLAGNSIGHPFEVDVFDKVERKTVSETVTLPFRIGMPSR